MSYIFFILGWIQYTCTSRLLSVLTLILKVVFKCIYVHGIFFQHHKKSFFWFDNIDLLIALNVGLNLIFKLGSIYAFFFRQKQTVIFSFVESRNWWNYSFLPFIQCWVLAYMHLPQMMCNWLLTKEFKIIQAGVWLKECRLIDRGTCGVWFYSILSMYISFFFFYANM